MRENRALRREFYDGLGHARLRPGPHAGSGTTRALIEEILALRHEAAQLVGFASFAEYSLATKMARDPAEVLRVPARARAR